jgi:NADH-quinone oxidoreductase subunit C
MTPEEICKRLQDRFPEAIHDAVADSLHPHVVVDVGEWLEVAQFLKDDQDLTMDWLRCISSVDKPDENCLTAVYDFHSTVHRHAFACKVFADRAAPHVPSVAHFWRAAEWHEREAYDLMGIVFDGNPDLRRILLPDDWDGHPLRKDYIFPQEYQGIPAVTDEGQVRPIR